MGFQAQIFKKVRFFCGRAIFLVSAGFTAAPHWSGPIRDRAREGQQDDRAGTQAVWLTTSLSPKRAELTGMLELVRP
jgi:hypothetical protein